MIGRFHPGASRNCYPARNSIGRILVRDAEFLKVSPSFLPRVRNQFLHCQRSAMAYEREFYGVLRNSVSSLCFSLSLSLVHERRTLPFNVGYYSRGDVKSNQISRDNH